MQSNYELALKLTEKQVDSTLNGWSSEGDDYKLFDQLVNLGDDRQLAMAKVLNKKARGELK